MAGDRITLVGGAQGFNWLPVFVALRRGLFVDAGINVALEKLGSIDKATQAVAAGAAELAITPPEGAVTDYVDGGELRIIASNSNRLPMSLVARPENRSIADLRGKRVGTSSLTEGTALYVQIMLAENGLRYPKDYEFALAGIHTSRWDALQKGEIDAAPQPAPWNFLAADLGYSLLGEVSDFLPEVLFAALIGRKQWLDGHDDVLSRLLVALDAAYTIVNDHSNEAECVEIFQEITTKDSRELARRGFIYMRDLGMWPDHMDATPKALATTIDLMVRANLLDGSRREMAAEAFDPVYLRNALSA